MNDLTKLEKFAQRYAKAWCSYDPEKVAAFSTENGSLIDLPTNHTNHAKKSRLKKISRQFVCFVGQSCY
jgi:hypothetical protein